jgi:hypothetical protein
MARNSQFRASCVRLPGPALVLRLVLRRRVCMRGYGCMHSVGGYRRHPRCRRGSALARSSCCCCPLPAAALLCLRPEQPRADGGAHQGPLACQAAATAATTDALPRPRPWPDEPLERILGHPRSAPARCCCCPSPTTRAHVDPAAATAGLLPRVSRCGRCAVGLRVLPGLQSLGSQPCQPCRAGGRWARGAGAERGASTPRRPWQLSPFWQTASGIDIIFISIYYH